MVELGIMSSVLKKIDPKLVIAITLLLLLPTLYFFRGHLYDFTNPATISEQPTVEFILVDESSGCSFQLNPLHPQDFRTFFLGYFFSQDVNRVFLHLTDQPQAVKNSWVKDQGQSVVYSSHSSHFPANNELHVFIHLNQAALLDAGWSSNMVSRHVESLFYQAIFIVSSEFTSEDKLASQLLNKSDQNLFLIGNE